MKKGTVNALVLLAAMASSQVMALDWSLEAGVEGRRFLQDGAFDGQVNDQWSVTLQPEVVWDAESYNGRFTFIPYYRHDFADEERTHGDVREAMLMSWGGAWELRAGVGKVFWGVTESLHLVDVINQTDLVESLDGEEKLGQPMVQGAWLSEAGTFEAFVLPYFRERTYAGEAGRMRLPVRVSDDALYQASEEEHHVDLALRWSRSLELNGYPLDVSASLFRGTSREPLFVPKIELVNSTPVVSGLTPFYPVQNQVGATLQFAPEGWLLKAELLHRDLQLDSLNGEKVEDQSAAVTGFEYTLVGPFDSAADLGLLLEYQYDSRGKSLAVAQNDVFLGTRLALNDMASSELLAGITQDLDYRGSRFFLVEGSTRLNPSTTLDLTMVLVAGEENDPLYTFTRDDSVELALNFYF